MKTTVPIVVIAVLIATAAYFFINSGHAANPEPAGYSYAVVFKGEIRQAVVATGLIKARVGAEVKVGAQVSGIVAELPVEVGAPVRKGQLLAVIDPEVYRTRSDQGAAARELAATEKKYALIELNRARELHQNNVIPDQQMDEASQRYEIASARLKQAEAESAYAALQLGYTRITSPIDGVVASIATQKGETVAASFTSPTFVTIIDPADLELWAYVDETDIGRITQNQSVSFTVDTYPGVRFEGNVQTIYPKADIRNNVVNYIAVIAIQRHPGKILRPEMTATIQIVISAKKNVAAVPKGAVRTEDGKTFVSMLVDGKPERKWIVTGISDDRVYEVISGVTEGDRVILK